MTTTSFLVLALVERLKTATAYDLKRLAHQSVFNFWSLPHSVLYSETERLERAGLLDSEQEQAGRRRRRYALTPAGLSALEEWRGTPTSDFHELRDHGLLQLFAGTQEQPLAELQLRRHHKQLEIYEKLHDQYATPGHLTAGMRLALEAGLGIEREYIRFWTDVSNGGANAQPAQIEAPRKRSSDPATRRKPTTRK